METVGLMESTIHMLWLPVSSEIPSSCITGVLSCLFHLGPNSFQKLQEGKNLFDNCWPILGPRSYISINKWEAQHSLKTVGHIYKTKDYWTSKNYIHCIRKSLIQSEITQPVRNL